MEAKQAAKLLKQIPLGDEVIIKNHWIRRTNQTGTLIAATIPADCKIPKGWHMAMSQQYEAKGKLRIQCFVEQVRARGLE